MNENERNMEENERNGKENERNIEGKQKKKGNVRKLKKMKKNAWK